MLTHLLLSVIGDYNSSEDIELLNRINQKDENALAELYDSYSKILYSLIIKIVKKQEDAEEILQSIFLQVWQKAEFFDWQRGNVYSWLFTMARNKSIDKIRSKNFKNDLNTIYYIDGLEIEDNNPGFGLNSLIAEERASGILKALNQLPEEQKEVIRLAYYEGYTQNKIAEILKIPLGTVKTRTRQALLKLGNLLRSKWGNYDGARKI